jgi:hypothetical protein
LNIYLHVDYQEVLSPSVEDKISLILSPIAVVFISNVSAEYNPSTEQILEQPGLGEEEDSAARREEEGLREALLCPSEP